MTTSSTAQAPAGAVTQTVTFDDHLCATGGGAQTWVDGHWELRGNDYIWIEGYWK